MRATQHPQWAKKGTYRNEKWPYVGPKNITYIGRASPTDTNGYYYKKCGSTYKPKNVPT